MEELKDYVSFDLEFTRVEDVIHLLQVSAVKYRNHEEVASFDQYVYYDLQINSFIAGLTGITSAQIQGAKPKDEVLVDFKEFIEDLPLIAYNGLKSDIPVLQSHGLDLEDQFGLDIYHLARDYRGTYLRGIEGLSLQKVAVYLQIKGRGHHALEDARMTAQVYQALLELEENEVYQPEQESLSYNPFASLDLSQFQ